MQAYMHAVKVDHASDRLTNFSKGCCLVTFIKELFVKKYATDVLQSILDNIKSAMKFEQAYHNTFLCFTHFVKAADDTATTSHTLFAAFIQGMAFVGSSQIAVDIMIPILLDDNDTLKEFSISILFIQAKWHKEVCSVNTYIIDQKTLKLFPWDNSKDKQPYITLIAELGAQPELPTA
jgi:hypothetical protein